MINRLRKAIVNKELVVFFADCEIEYEGRGRSKIGRGERLIIIKPDGTIIVHRPSGREPVNWQPPGTSITISEKNNVIILRSARVSPHEILRIFIYEVIDLISHKLCDSAEFIMWMDEKEMRNVLASHLELIRKNLKLIDVEYGVPSGYIDILARDSEGNLFVIEIKRVTAQINAVIQLERYVNDLRNINPGVKVYGILVAPSINKKAMSELMKRDFIFKRITPMQCYKIHKKIKGISKFIL